MIMLRHFTPPHLSLFGSSDEFNNINVAHKTERRSEFYNSISKPRIKDKNKQLGQGNMLS